MWIRNLCFRRRLRSKRTRCSTRTSRIDRIDKQYAQHNFAFCVPGETGSCRSELVQHVRGSWNLGAGFERTRACRLSRRWIHSKFLRGPFCVFVWKHPHRNSFIQDAFDTWMKFAHELGCALFCHTHPVQKVCEHAFLVRRSECGDGESCVLFKEQNNVLRFVFTVPDSIPNTLSGTVQPVRYAFIQKHFDFRVQNHTVMFCWCFTLRPAHLNDPHGQLVFMWIVCFHGREAFVFIAKFSELMCTFEWFLCHLFCIGTERSRSILYFLRLIFYGLTLCVHRNEGQRLLGLTMSHAYPCSASREGSLCLSSRTRTRLNHLLRRVRQPVRVNYGSVDCLRLDELTPAHPIEPWQS